MARHHATVLTAIWSDADWLELSPGAQRLYMLLLSQPGLSFIGHLDVLPHRWARFARDTTIETISEDLLELEAARFVAVDHDTQEVLIRSLVRHDFRADRFNRNLAKALWTTWSQILSPALRRIAIENLPQFVWKHSSNDFLPAEAERIRRSHGSQPFAENGSEPSSDNGSEPLDVDGGQPPPPSTHCVPPTSSSSREPRDNAPESYPQDDDDDRRIEITLAILAERDLTARQCASHLAPIADTDSWLRKAIGQRRQRHRDALAQLVIAHPELRPDELADLLEPPPTPAEPRDPRVKGYDEQQRAERQRAEQHMRDLAEQPPIDVSLNLARTADARDALRHRPPTQEPA